jgi:hypothetical protein
VSNRTLIEINHDFCHALDHPKFLRDLRRYLNSASRETADALERYGVRVIGMRHHSGNFVLDGEPDGFPVQYLERVRFSKTGSS